MSSCHFRCSDRRCSGATQTAPPASLQRCRLSSIFLAPLGVSLTSRLNGIKNIGRRIRLAVMWRCRKSKASPISGDRKCSLVRQSGCCPKDSTSMGRITLVFPSPILSCVILPGLAMSSRATTYCTCRICNRCSTSNTSHCGCSSTLHSRPTSCSSRSSSIVFFSAARSRIRSSLSSSTHSWSHRRVSTCSSRTAVADRKGLKRRSSSGCQAALARSRGVTIGDRFAARRMLKAGTCQLVFSGSRVISHSRAFSNSRRELEASLSSCEIAVWRVSRGSISTSGIL